MAQPWCIPVLAGLFFSLFMLPCKDLWRTKVSRLVYFKLSVTLYFNICSCQTRNRCLELGFLPFVHYDDGNYVGIAIIKLPLQKTYVEYRIIKLGWRDTEWRPLFVPTQQKCRDNSVCEGGALESLPSSLLSWTGPWYGWPRGLDSVVFKFLFSSSARSLSSPSVTLRRFLHQCRMPLTTPEASPCSWNYASLPRYLCLFLIGIFVCQNRILT